MCGLGVFEMWLVSLRNSISNSLELNLNLNHHFSLVTPELDRAAPANAGT